MYWVLLIKMWPVWALLIVAPPARGHLEVTLSVFLNSGGSWWFFIHEIYIKSNGRLSKNTYVFESLFPDIYFTGWSYFCYIFSVFAGLTGVISGFVNFFYYFIFLTYFTVTCIYNVGWFILYRLFIGSFSTNGYVSQREAPDNILISRPMRSLQKYETTHVVYAGDREVCQKNKIVKNINKTRDNTGLTGENRENVRKIGPAGEVDVRE